MASIVTMHCFKSLAQDLNVVAQCIKRKADDETFVAPAFKRPHLATPQPAPTCQTVEEIQSNAMDISVVKEVKVELEDKEPSVFTYDSQLTEHIFDGKSHKDYWNGQDTSKSDCPECGKVIRVVTARRTHYLQYHYDIYFSLIDHLETESWVGRRVGSYAEQHWEWAKRGEEGDEQIVLKATPASRVCLYCNDTSKLYNGRAALVRHMGKAHPAECRALMLGYKYISTKNGKIVHKYSFEAQGGLMNMVPNMELHELLTTSPLAIMIMKEPKDETKEEECITID